MLYTIVGRWLDNSRDSYVEHIEADNITNALIENSKINCREPEQVIAIFPGYHVDLLTEEAVDEAAAWERCDGCDSGTAVTYSPTGDALCADCADKEGVTR